MKLISELPTELIIHIYEYIPEHREKMRWILQDICDIQYCEVCDKIIMKYVYSMRRSNIICCSAECVDRCY